MNILDEVNKNLSEMFGSNVLLVKTVEIRENILLELINTLTICANELKIEKEKNALLEQENSSLRSILNILSNK